MKKIILTLATLFVLTSCSKDDPSNPTSLDSGLVLLKKMGLTNPQTNVTTSGEFTYDGNKIVQSTLGTAKTVYTYTGELITKTNTTFTDATPPQQTIYTYENNNLKTALLTTTSVGSISTNFSKKTDYQYKTDGTISYTEVSKFSVSNLPPTTITGKLYFTSGNLTKKETEYYNGSTVVSRTVVTNEFDNKNNPYKNVLGYNKLLDLETNNFTNNITKSSTQYSTIVDGVTSPTSRREITYTYTYSEKDYPLAASFSGFGPILTIIYSY
jgi:hypothetical protein